MHLLTHALSGWCVGNLLQAGPKERALCIAVSLCPDLDGLSIVGGVQSYWDYHHIVAHNAAFAVIASVACAMLTPNRAANAMRFMVIIHLHFIMDLFGSGRNWGIAYAWPFEIKEYFASRAWELGAWQNYTALVVFAVWSIAVALVQRRTPLEYVAPRFHSGVLRACNLMPKQ